MNAVFFQAGYYDAAINLYGFLMAPRWSTRPDRLYGRPSAQEGALSHVQLGARAMWLGQQLVERGGLDPQQVASMSPREVFAASARLLGILPTEDPFDTPEAIKQYVAGESLVGARALYAALSLGEAIVRLRRKRWLSGGLALGLALGIPAVDVIGAWKAMRAYNHAVDMYLAASSNGQNEDVSSDASGLPAVRQQINGMTY